ncbi:MAG TPA: hypothetical protein VGP72_12565 [Planctomycetota bacterium]|jgi:hypothetical protein
MRTNDTCVPLWVCLVLTASPLLGGAAELKTGTFKFAFADDGRPAALSTTPANEAVLDTRNPGPGFYLTGPGTKRTPLNKVTLEANNRLAVRSPDGDREVIFAIGAAPRHLAFRIESVKGLPTTPETALHFEMNAKACVRVTELDYMTHVQNESYGVRVHWDTIWHRTPANPLGGFALFVAKDDTNEDETLLRIWVEEKLAHPKVAGDWTLERARAWLADWQRIFADRSQMILEADSLEDLRASIPWAEKAQIQEIYLFTQTWRTDNFWPRNNGNVHVNRKVFPRGEEDLKDFSDFLRAKGMRLNLHYVSGGLGTNDQTYVGSKPDRRLASWVQGTLAKPATPTDKELVVQPPAGANYPPVLPHFFEHKHVRIEDEIVQVGAFEVAQNGTWLLRNCQRGRPPTQATVHAAGAEAAGLLVPYGQNYVPDNDSTLLGEIAANYARLINTCGIAHTEYDGAEIHCYSGKWGYLKFATKVYENIDHPVTAHDSSGSAPRCNYEYRFKSTERILRGRCPFTHGNWSAPVELASPSRVASTLLDANFVLSQGNLGGALGLCKPEPMFAVSDRSLRAHGLSAPVIETLLNWKAVSRLLTDEQRAKIDASFTRPTRRMPESSHHVVSRFVQTVRKTADGYAIVPICVMTRKSGDILWQQGQEHGAVSPRQYVKPGEELTLENPFAAQPVKFIVRVLWEFDPKGRSVAVKDTRGKPAAVVHREDLFTAGNEGGTIDRSKLAPNIILHPSASQIRIPADATPKTTVTEEGAGLRLQAQNPGTKDAWEMKLLPEWNCGVDMSASRGIGMRVTGDGSGAILLFQVPGRDYVLPIDFTGSRDIEIPNGEVAWASGAWGWRMDTKRGDYSRVSWCRLGFGCVPAGKKASVLVEDLKTLGEIPVALQNPVIRTGAGLLTVKGSVESGQILQYDGGETATVFDENWKKLAELPVERNHFAMPAGWAPVSISAPGSDARPWLEVQFMTEGEPMPVPAK